MGLLALAAVFGCKSADGYAHMGIDISVDGLTAEQKKLVSAIQISSQPEGNTDPNKIYRVGVNASELDAHGAAHADYIPNPQSGTFVVSVALLDAKSEQLAIKSQKTKVVAGKAADLNFDFVSEISKQGDCRTEGDPTLLTESPLGGNSLSVLWDVDHYQVVYTDLSLGNGDLMTVKLDEQGQPLAPAINIQTSPRVSALPSIAKTDAGYVVAWQEGNKLDPNPVSIQIRLLDKDGNPAGNARQIMTNATEARPMVKVVDGKIAMVWIDDRGTVAAPARIAMLAYLSADDFAFEPGSPLTLSPPDTSLGNDDAFPAVAVTSAGLAVSWIGDDKAVFSANISPSLEMTNATMVYTSDYVAQQLAVVSTGDDLFSAWEDLSGDISLGRERIRGAFVSNTGDVGPGGIVQEIDSGSANWPRMAWNEKDSVAVVYYQYREFGSQIYLTRYSLDGERLANTDYPFTNVAGHAKYPEISFRGMDFDGHDHFGLGWADDHTGVQRIYFQPIVCD